MNIHNISAWLCDAIYGPPAVFTFRTKSKHTGTKQKTKLKQKEQTPARNVGDRGTFGNTGISFEITKINTQKNMYEETILRRSAVVRAEEIKACAKHTINGKRSAIKANVYKDVKALLVQNYTASVIARKLGKGKRSVEYIIKLIKSLNPDFR